MAGKAATGVTEVTVANTWGQVVFLAATAEPAAPVLTVAMVATEARASQAGMLATVALDWSMAAKVEPAALDPHPMPLGPAVTAA
jgi:hypothetical protein